MREPRNQATAHIEALLSELSNVEPLERQSALFELAGIGKPAIPDLLRLLRSSQAHLRWAACRALAEIADPETAQQLVRELADEEEEIRVPAAMGLTAMKRKGIKHLLRALCDSRQAAVIMHEAYPVLYELSRQTWGHPLKPVMLAITGGEVDAVPRAARIAIAEIRHRGD